MKLTFLGCATISLFLGQTSNVNAKISIILHPSESSGTKFENASTADELYNMYVTSPETNEIVCKTSALDTDCFGNFTADLSSRNEIELSFRAPPGKELLFKAATSEPPDSAMEFEFIAEIVHCDMGSSDFQEIRGDDVAFKWNVIGSETTGLTEHFDEVRSFIKIGREDDENPCNLFARLRFNDVSDEIHITEVTWGGSYDSGKVPAGNSTFSYDSGRLSWISQEEIKTGENPLTCIDWKNDRAFRTRRELNEGLSCPLKPKSTPAPSSSLVPTTSPIPTSRPTDSPSSDDSPTSGQSRSFSTKGFVGAFLSTLSIVVIHSAS